MSAERLREAAALMREQDPASWRPVVALAVADALEDVAVAWDACQGWTLDLDNDAIAFEDTVDGGWLAVANAYLGGES